jgi:hypothetical protein
MSEAELARIGRLAVEWWKVARDLEIYWKAHWREGDPDDLHGRETRAFDVLVQAVRSLFAEEERCPGGKQS